MRGNSKAILLIEIMYVQLSLLFHSSQNGELWSAEVTPFLSMIRLVELEHLHILLIKYSSYIVA